VKLREIPCAQCGWKFPGFHVCVDLSKPCALEAPKPVSKKGTGRGSNLATLRAQIREENSERDAEIVARYYSEGISYKDLAKDIGLHHHTVARIVNRAKANQVTGGV